MGRVSRNADPETGEVNECVTSRMGRVSRNMHWTCVQKKTGVTSRMGRVSRNMNIFQHLFTHRLSRPAWGV